MKRDAEKSSVDLSELAMIKVFQYQVDAPNM